MGISTSDPVLDPTVDPVEAVDDAVDDAVVVVGEVVEVNGGVGEVEEE